jgi:hypothetical protein
MEELCCTMELWKYKAGSMFKRTSESGDTPSQSLIFQKGPCSTLMFT